MSKDHAIMLLGEAIHIMENWTAYERPLSHALSLLREARGNLEVAPVAVVTLIGDCVPAAVAPVQVDAARAVLARAVVFLDYFRNYAASEENEPLYRQSRDFCREVVAFLEGK